MPVTTEKRGNKIRVVEARTGQLARNANGTPVDGGGFPDTPDGRRRARAQARAINANLDDDASPVEARRQ